MINLTISKELNTLIMCVQNTLLEGYSKIHITRQLDGETYWHNLWEISKSIQQLWGKLELIVDDHRETVFNQKILGTIGKTQLQKGRDALKDGGVEKKK